MDKLGETGIAGRIARHQYSAGYHRTYGYRLAARLEGEYLNRQYALYEKRPREAAAAARRLRALERVAANRAKRRPPR